MLYIFMAEQLVGKSALSRAELHNTAKQILSGVGRMGLGVMDIALWDIAGKAAGVPVYQLLGGNARDKIRVYRGIGGRNGLKCHGCWWRSSSMQMAS